MSELDDFAAAILDAWHGEGQGGNGPIPVGELLDRVFPYPVARRRLGIDVSEDYEALVLRLLAEEGGRTAVAPPDAAEMARTTMSEKLPDLTVLQLLRGAFVTLKDATKVPGHGAPPPAPKARMATTPHEKATMPAPMTSSVAPALAATRCWSCDANLPTTRTVKFCPECGADQRPPSCLACQEPLERGWKHCPECGQRVERSAPPPP